MQSVPKLVVFDMAGTTVQDGDRAVARCLVEALATVQVAVPLQAAVALMGIPKPIAIRDLMGDKANDEMVEAVHQDFIVRMNRFYETDASVAPIPGAEETFAVLRQAGIKVALDTGFSRDIADTIIHRLCWQSRIDASITSDEVEKGRPYPDMIVALMQRFGIETPLEVAKVGDTPSDMEQGTAAGCRWVIGVTEGTHTYEQLAACPHTHLVRTVAEVPQVLGIGECRG